MMQILTRLVLLALFASMVFCRAVDNDQAPISTNIRPERQAEGHHDAHDAVDFGAHTGDHGAFGWYADFPVHGSGYK